MQDSVTQSKSCLDAVLKILYLDQKIFVISHLLDIHSQIHLENHHHVIYYCKRCGSHVKLYLKDELSKILSYLLNLNYFYDYCFYQYCEKPTSHKQCLG